MTPFPPLIGPSGAGIDSYTKVMLHCDAATITDSSSVGRTVTLGGSAARTTAQFKFGGSSLSLAAGSWATFPDAADLEFGSADWTVDQWFRLNTLSSALAVPETLLSHRTDLNNMFRIFLNTDDSISFQQVDAGAQTVGAGSAANAVAAVATWYHIAVQRLGTLFGLFLNGVLVGQSNSTAAMTNYTGVWSMGALDDATQTWPLDGWVDELRISVGKARWRSSFQPPSYAYRKTG